MDNKTKKKELSVEAVALQLGVSERSIVNYLKTRRIEGIKVGKKWFIDSASVDVFAQRYGFIPKIVPPIVTQQTVVVPGIPTPKEERHDKTGSIGSNRHSSLSQLHLFQLCVEVLSAGSNRRNASLALQSSGARGTMEKRNPGIGA